MNLLQQLFQDLVGTKIGEADEAAIQPTLNLLTPVVTSIIAPKINAAAAKSPTLAGILALAEAPGGPLASLSPTSTVSTSVAIGSVVDSLMSKIGDELGASTSIPTPSGATVTQVVTVLNATASALGIPSADNATLDAAFTQAIGSQTSFTESDALSALNSILTANGLPAADEPTFATQFESQWTASGYPVPANPS